MNIFVQLVFIYSFTSRPSWGHAAVLPTMDAIKPQDEMVLSRKISEFEHTLGTRPLAFHVAAIDRPQQDVAHEGTPLRIKVEEKESITKIIGVRISKASRFMNSLDNAGMVWFAVFAFSSLGLTIIALLLTSFDMHRTAQNAGYLVPIIICTVLTFIALVSLLHLPLYMDAKTVAVSLLNAYILSVGAMTHATGIGDAEDRASRKVSAGQGLARRSLHNLHSSAWRTDSLCASAYFAQGGYRVDNEIVVNHTLIFDSNGPPTAVVHYLREGPVSHWSPVARWNAVQPLAHRRIPNPSICALPIPSPRLCPGYFLWRHGRNGPCECVRAMTSVGLEPLTRDLIRCGTSRYDTLADELSSLLADSPAQESRTTGSYKTNAATAPTNALSLVGSATENSDRDLLGAHTSSCVGSYDASRAELVDPAYPLHEATIYDEFYPTLSGAHDWDNPAFSLDAVGWFTSTESTAAPALQWRVRHCLPQLYAMDLRYASSIAFDMEITIDGVQRAIVRVPPTQNNSSQPTTPDRWQDSEARRSALVFQRNNFVLNGLALDAGDHIIRITKKAGQSGGGPAIHRLNLCTQASVGSTVGGCLLHRVMNNVYCFRPLLHFDPLTSTRLFRIAGKSSFTTELNKTWGNADEEDGEHDGASLKTTQFGTTVDVTVDAPLFGGLAPLFFSNLEEAKSACVARADCLGIAEYSIGVTNNSSKQVVARVVTTRDDFHDLVVAVRNLHRRGEESSFRMLVRETGHFC